MGNATTLTVYLKTYNPNWRTLNKKGNSHFTDLSGFLSMWTLLG